MRKHKRIAVFLGEIGREFQKEFVDEFQKVALSKGYDVFVFNNFGSYDCTELFDLGERDTIHIPSFSEFEGVVSLADTFDIDGMERMLINKIRSEKDIPIVSIRNGAEDTYRITLNDYETIYEMTNHFIKEHGFKNIGFMAGPLNVEDSVQRLKGFKAAMKDAGLEISSDVVFEGDFWKFKSREAADYFLSAYDGDIEAIICANDYMAVGLMEELNLRGVRVPDDIAISGFDEVLEGKLSLVPLTTVAIPIAGMAGKALEIIEKVNAGKKVSPKTGLVGNIIPKCSCGCQYDRSSIDYASLFKLASEDYISVRRSVQFISDIQNHITEIDKLNYVNRFTSGFRIKKMFLCLCTADNKDDNPYSETMLLRTIFPFAKDQVAAPIINHSFPRKDILPDEYFDYDEPTCHVVFPIHHKHTTFGYIVSEWSEDDITIFIASYGAGFANAYNDLKLQEEFSELVDIKKQNLIDPLTGISNRRGFEQSLNNLMIKKQSEYDLVSFLSIDLDNLKEINDTYGHAEGDIAIKTVADALYEVVGENDICARVGGDEFYAIITTNNTEIETDTLSRFYELLDSKSSELDKKYALHASVGIYTVKNNLIDRAFEHLQVADRLMYEAKRKYKAKL